VPQTAGVGAGVSPSANGGFTNGSGASKLQVYSFGIVATSDRQVSWNVVNPVSPVYVGCGLKLSQSSVMEFILQ